MLDDALIAPEIAAGGNPPLDSDWDTGATADGDVAHSSNSAADDEVDGTNPDGAHLAVGVRYFDTHGGDIEVRDAATQMHVGSANAANQTPLAIGVWLAALADPTCIYVAASRTLM